MLTDSKKTNMKEKIQQIIRDMSRRVVIDRKHIYTDNETGLYLQGVSSVSNIVPKDWLSAWGAKEAVKALGFSDYEGDHALATEVLAKIKTLELKQYLALLKEAKGASARKSKTAMIDGKVGHEWLELFVKQRIEGKETVLPGGTLDRPLKQFLEWENGNVDYWIASEALVAYPEKMYAGTLDAIAILKTGKLALIDFKFASNISEDYWLQTAGYAACFEPYEILFDERIIIRLPKTLEKDDWDKANWKYIKVPNNIEVQRVPTNYIADREAFFAALKVKGWINSVVKK